MTGRVKEYWSDDIVVTYDAGRCIHAAECIRGLPGVFDTSKRPWIQPANATATQVAEVVQRCPTGALHFQRKDGGAAETPPEQDVVQVRGRGPLYVRGDIEVVLPDGSVLHDTRIALCRCGASQDKPFCDNSHLQIAFAASGVLGENNRVRLVEGLDTGGKLRVTPTVDGPVRVEGAFEVHSADGQTVYRGNRASLCRCGGSANKPFCDGTHSRLGFQAEGR
jgi:CDGSH-type Zn-finger protein/uncharacterized Fe-S cluster protein YjdI